MIIKQNPPPHLTQKLSFFLQIYKSSSFEELIYKMEHSTDCVPGKFMQVPEFSAQFIKCVEQWNIEKFQQYRFLATYQVLTKIDHISFTHLKLIDLSYSYIFKIQEITWMDFPLLQEINLANNLIASLKSFSKTNLSKLQTISLKHNRLNITQCGFMNRTRSSNFSKLLQLECMVELFLIKSNNKNRLQNCPCVSSTICQNRKGNKILIKICSIMVRQFSHPFDSHFQI